MARVIVVGSANVDFVVQTPHIPRPGETVLGRDFVMAMGGKGANQAVGAARLGADVVFVARIGQDIFGDQCLEAYASEGIDINFVSRDPDQATGVALIAVSADGENSITVASGANMSLRPEHVQSATHAFNSVDALLLQLEVPLDTILESAQLARQSGAKVILNPAPAQPLPAELLGLVDVFTPNRVELAQLLKCGEETLYAMSDEEMAKSALSLGPAEVVITLGADGALAAGSWGWVRIPAFQVEVVDTTAAGDAFNAGLVTALARKDFSLDQAARFASACGALAAMRLGAQPSLPDARAVEALLAKQK